MKMKMKKLKVDYQHIKELLEKFYEGLSTTEEEEVLFRFFDNSSDLPDEFQADIEVFRTLKTNMEKTAIPIDLEKKIMDSINSKAIINHLKSDSLTVRFKRKFIYYVSAIALIGIIFSAIIISFDGGKSMEVNRKIASSDSISAIAVAIPIDDNSELNENEKNTHAVAVGDLAFRNSGKVSDNKHAEIVGAAIDSNYNQTVSISNITDDIELSLTDEEMAALYLGLSILKKADEKLTFALQRVETIEMSVDRSLSQIRNVWDKVYNNDLD